MRGDGSVAHYAARRSELVRLIRNLSEHFADQRADVQAMLLSASDASAGQGGADSMGLARQEIAVGRFFFTLFPGLVVKLWVATRGWRSETPGARGDQQAAAAGH